AAFRCPDSSSTTTPSGFTFISRALASAPSMIRLACCKVSLVIRPPERSLYSARIHRGGSCHGGLQARTAPQGIARKNQRADARVRSGAVGRLRATRGVSQLDVRLPEPGSGRARVRPRRGTRAPGARRERGADLFALQPPERRDSRGTGRAAGA